MFENPRRGRQARNFTTKVSKILDLKSSSEQIFFRKLSLGAPVGRNRILVVLWTIIFLSKVKLCKSCLKTCNWFVVWLRMTSEFFHLLSHLLRLEKGYSGSLFFHLTLYTLRVISIKFLLVIAMLCKTKVVMRIKDMITQDVFAWYFVNFSPLLL